jgi:flavin-dependent dehydrogenase
MNPAPPSHEYDAIVVGGRVAGTAAAIMLGRKRLRVLLVDKSAFPSDTISTHIVLAGGAAVLQRMGVIDMLESLGASRVGAMRTIVPGCDYSARLDPNDRGLCLTRLKMDSAMLTAARALECVAVREQFRVTDLIVEDGAIAGIRGQDSSGAHEFRAPLVIGADGIHGVVAKIASERVGAFERRDVPCARAYYYAYYDGVSGSRLGDELVTEFESKPGRASLICRCEDGLVVAATAFDAAEMREFRTDLEHSFSQHLAESLLVGEVLRGARMVGKVRSSGLLLNTWRAPACAGALLLGDSGLHVDPLFGQGHSFALMSAEIFGELAPEWFAASSGAAISADAMAELTRRRDAALMPFFNATVRISRELGLDDATMLAHRAANSQAWAAEEFVRFGQMAGGSRNFPSFRFARQMARCRAA